MITVIANPNLAFIKYKENCEWKCRRHHMFYTFLEFTNR
jgi:hypothetical protein